MKILRIITISLLLSSGIEIHANDDLIDSTYFRPSSSSSYGGVGLIEIPTARFPDDGEFGFGISREDPYRRLFARMQFFPWLEGIVKYTEDTHQPYNRGSTQTLKDKGIDIRVKLFEETRRMPALAFGLADFGGTGRFAGEYLVASKALNNIDFSVGLGWGKYNGLDHIKNPLGYICDSCKVRGGYASLGGKLNLGRIMSGDNSSFFGGFQYQTPIPNLSLKVEYDPSDYSEPTGAPTHINRPGNLFRLDSRINYGLDYQYRVSERDNIGITLGYVRGNTIYANIAIHSNLNFRGREKDIAPKEILNVPYLESFDKLDDHWQKYLSDLIMWQMGNVGFVTHNLIFDDNEMAVEISQGRFLDTVKAIDLAARILGNNSPKNIDKITIINVDQGIETLRATIPRDILVDSVSKGPIDPNLLEYTSAEEFSTKAIVRQNDYLYPNFTWQIKPRALGTLQHQAKFYFWQLEALIHTEYSIKKGLYFTTDIGIDIANNYEEYTFHIPDGKLHHVRQNRRLYLTEGKSGLRRMALDYAVDFTPEIKGKFSAGLLEWMYGGVGGEVIYMPFDKNWALGIDGYWIKQREYDQKFSFRDYQTFTGFLSLYYDLPFYDMRVKVSGGKFLGKDKGMLLDISRRFKTGARVGGMVALTDCDAGCVGEGSFNKWIYFDLPMNLFYQNSSTKSKAGYYWSPLTKDAGQKVETGGGLYRVMTYAKDEVDSIRRKPWSIRKIVSGFGTQPKSRT